jgi:hypothetical protein
MKGRRTLQVIPWFVLFLFFGLPCYPSCQHILGVEPVEKTFGKNFTGFYEKMASKNKPQSTIDIREIVT